MNTTLRHWKEAATLILAAGHRLGPGSLPSRTPLTAAPGPGAPLTAAPGPGAPPTAAPGPGAPLTAAPGPGAPPTAAPGPGAPPGSIDGRSHLPHKSFYDYDVLLLKRSSKSRFMPNAYVFPGGMVDASDFSSEWLDIFKSFSNSPNFGLRRVKQPPETRPPMFATDRLKLGSPIPGEVAFRICALRETFEESGVLLVVSKLEEKSLLKDIGGRCDSDKVLHNKVSELNSSDVTKWRALVNENPSNFIRMCRELEVLPNIWALHEWSNWLTPTGRRGARYDTVFFICCLQEIPLTLQDEKEIVHFKWSTPSEVLQSYQAQEFWIAPPQFYELSRMCRLPLLNDLHKFSSQRATEGLEQWLPVVFTEDGAFISLLPGDKSYPLDTSEEAQVDTCTESDLESPQDAPALHRSVIVDPYTINVQITIPPKYNHLLPVLEEAAPLDSKSQL
ncbi:nucleoside diphosphate-linked moiety X motif 19 isoform X1 [Labrus mixtus]|uniref:nucleoside diphosphate-linked moiety X motif 19 isoform X1 n=1 Tax=Labrus mixtus TaxID=508554 RepID=UPI0029C06108|nr:nucleoside diphosphate-linked moiety X motif 19 isoform X1 [Labrus mixtus]